MDLLDDQLLALRQLDQVCDPGAKDIDRREERGHHLRRGNGAALAPPLEPLEQRVAGREQLVEPFVRLAIDVLGPVVGADAVTAFHLVGVRERLAREHAGGDADPADLVAQPCLSVRLEAGRREVALEHERLVE